MQGVKGVIFDIDGTLLDSMWIWGDVAERYMSRVPFMKQPNPPRLCEERSDAAIHNSD